MIEAPLPENELERLQALARYNILDTLPEEDFDDLTTDHYLKDKYYLKSRVAIDIKGKGMMMTYLLKA